MTIALSIWGFAFSVDISAPDLDTCLLWHKISAFGWGSLFSILLHFFLDLTGKKKIIGKMVGVYSNIFAIRRYNHCIWFFYRY